MHPDALARQVNARIREIAAKFAMLGLEEEPLDLLCECGCLGVVRTATLREYDALNGLPLLSEGHPTPLGVLAD